MDRSFGRVRRNESNSPLALTKTPSFHISKKGCRYIILMVFIAAR